MRAFFQRPVIRRCRRVFRWCRMTVWLILFVVVSAIAYLHTVGLPDFVKRPLLRRLLADGFATQFTNIQLGWGPSIIVEDVAFSRSNEPLSPQLSASRAELALDWRSLVHFRLEARSLQVDGAKLQFPVSTNNGDALSLTNVVLDLRFNTNDVARINFCRGVFDGIQVDLLAKANHASGIGQWKFPLRGGTGNRGYQPRLQEAAHFLKNIRFSGTPVLEIEAGADGSDMNSFHAEMKFAALAVQTPWCDVTNLSMDAACARLIDPGSLPFMHVEWSATDVDTRWARSRKVSFSTSFIRGADTNFNTQVQCEADDFQATADYAGSNWFGASHISWSGSASLAYSNFAPLNATGKLRAQEPQTAWGSAREMSVDCRAARAGDARSAQASWGPWTNFAPWTLDYSTEFDHVTHPKIRAERLSFSGHWRAPQLTVENLQGKLYDGQISAGASLDVGTRELQCDCKADFDPKGIVALLTAPAGKWMSQLDWQSPPRVGAQLRVVLPPWTDRPADWAGTMASSLQLEGDVALGPASFRQATVNSAQSHFSYANGIWTVSHLHAVRPDGDINLDYSSSVETLDYRFIFDSRLDPRAAAPLLNPKQQRFLDEAAFKQPPRVRAQVWGCWRRPESVAFTAEIEATNFIARGEPFTAFKASVDYTNLILSIHNLSVSNEECHAQIPFIQGNFNTKIVVVSNAAGTLNTPALKQVVGKKCPDFFNVFHFDVTPSVSASGFFSLTNLQTVGLHFFVSGQRLHYTNLMADHISGEVNWVGHEVALTNIAGTAYNNGAVNGLLVFDTRPKRGSDFLADFNVKNIDLSSLILGLTGKTNHIEGRLDGHLNLRGPNNTDRPDLQGRGHVHVHNALLWDIKVFGLFSPVLNAISPGWGHSRAREASATFVVTNGAVSSDNLEVRFTGFHLNLRGSVDKNKQVNARLEAVLSREMPVLGPLLGLAFAPFSKLFEYHIAGPLSNPTMEPVFIPRVVMYLLRPFHTIKTIATPNPSPAPAGNAK